MLIHNTMSASPATAATSSGSLSGLNATPTCSPCSRAAAERVRPGGTVVYSVCTLNADENEAVVDASGFAIDDLGTEWPAFAHPKRREFLLTTPHRHHTSGFFVARLKIAQ